MPALDVRALPINAKHTDTNPEPLMRVHLRSNRTFTKWVFIAVLPAMLLALSSCGGAEEWDQFWDKFKDKGEQPTPTPPMMNSRGKGLQGTIGQLVTIDGLQMTQVSGYGLVTGLVDTGGSDGPEVVKEYLVKEIRRNQGIGEPGMPAEEILGSRDTAMVAVTGRIPAGAKKGDRFDVGIEALGSQTKSLVGGRLVLCDLKLYAETPQGIIEGKTLAIATGPVFVSPFDRAGRPTSKVDLRRGMVMSGGVVKEPRRVRLLLTDPRYSVAQQIENRINGRYAGLDPIANAKSPGAIDVDIPANAQDQKRLFLERVMHTTLNGNTPFLEERARDLGDEIVDIEPEYETIGLAWEAIGKIGLPAVKKHYASEQPGVSYYSGRTGLRLGDREGMRVVAKHARNSQSPYRKQAIDELGWAIEMSAAGEALRKVLDDEDTDIRIRAYLALRRHRNPAIETRVLDQDNLILDVIDTSGPYLVYVQRMGEPRIAIFGRRMRCNPPALFPDIDYRDDERELFTTLTAELGDDKMTLIYKNRWTGMQSPRLQSSLNVGELIRFLGGHFSLDDDKNPTGLAVPYSEVVDILGAFCKRQTIPADFITDEMTTETEEEEGKERQETEY